MLQQHGAGKQVRGCRCAESFGLLPFVRFYHLLDLCLDRVQVE
jgi:hypothetical protein